MHTQCRRRMLIAMTIAGVGIVALLVAIGVYGLLRGTASDPTPSGPSPRATDAPTAASVSHPRPLVVRADSEEFARAAAIALFGWDTRGSAGPSEWAQVLIDVGDPEEVAGLALDIRGYLPTIEQWEQLAAFGTRQRLAIESARIPTAWATAVAQAAPGQLPPGAVAYTITGIRHRDGVWEDETITTRRDVIFTVFVACPRAKECRLLRLSRMNEPLE